MARRLDPSGKLPPFSWLYKHPDEFMATPSNYPRKCGWCSETFWILNNMVRVCPKCDMGEGK